jgi:hypothetical protein
MGALLWLRSGVATLCFSYLRSEAVTSRENDSS